MSTKVWIAQYVFKFLVSKNLLQEYMLTTYHRPGTYNSIILEIKERRLITLNILLTTGTTNIIHITLPLLQCSFCSLPCLLDNSTKWTEHNLPHKPDNHIIKLWHSPKYANASGVKAGSLVQANVLFGSCFKAHK